MDDRPVAIYDQHNADLFHASSDATQEAWNGYAEKEAVICNAECYGPDKSTSTLYQWTPPLSFTGWLAKERGETPDKAAYPTGGPKVPVDNLADAFTVAVSEARHQAFREAAEIAWKESGSPVAVRIARAIERTAKPKEDGE